MKKAMRITHNSGALTRLAESMLHCDKPACVLGGIRFKEPRQ
jgi:hypothetical protein